MSRKKQTPLAGGAGEHGQAHHGDHSTRPFPKGLYAITARMLHDGMHIYKAELQDVGRIPGADTFGAYIDSNAEWPGQEPVHFVLVPAGAEKSFGLHFLPGIEPQDVVVDVRNINRARSVMDLPCGPFDVWREAMRRELMRGRDAG